MGVRKIGTGDGSDERRAWVFAVLTGVCLALLAASLSFFFERTVRQQREMQVRQLAMAVAHDLGGRLDRSLSAAIALGAVLRQGGGQVDNFPFLARELISEFGGISALQLAPGGTIVQVEPLAGNERVIGFSPVNDPVQGAEARRAIELRKLVLTGPFDLRQGGVGVVGRNPVFIRGVDGQEKFWGLVQVLIRVPDLLVMTRLDAVERAGLRYELWRLRPNDGERQVFARSSEQGLERPVDVRIPVPNGEWILSVAPDAGWYSRLSLLIEGAIVVFVSLLGAIAAYLAWHRLSARIPEGS